MTGMPCRLPVIRIHPGKVVSLARDLEDIPTTAIELMMASDLPIEGFAEKMYWIGCPLP